jgi:hypothetical protein
VKPGTSSTPTDMDGLRLLITLKISEPKRRAKHKNSEDEERVGKTTG